MDARGAGRRVGHAVTAPLPPIKDGSGVFAGVDIMRANPPAGVWRILHWLAAWRRNDPVAPHAHIGPLGVLPAWRRQDIARALMLQYLRRLDALGTVAWLETDLTTNVAFYETLGFVVACREPVLGAANWFMRREPSTPTVASP